MKEPKNKEDMLKALAGNIPAEIIDANKLDVIPVELAMPTAEELIKDSEEDYEFVRDHTKKLVATTDDAIGLMMNLAQDSEHPRAFEVLANLIKTAADVNNQILIIHRERKKSTIDSKKGEGGPAVPTTTTNNNVIFTGTTTELQKFFADKKKAAAEIVVNA